jgi:hypothetical protein
VATFFQTLVEFSAIELECSMPKLASDWMYLFARAFIIAIIFIISTIIFAIFTISTISIAFSFFWQRLSFFDCTKDSDSNSPCCFEFRWESLPFLSMWLHSLPNYFDQFRLESLAFVSLWLDSPPNCFDQLWWESLPFEIMNLALCGVVGWCVLYVFAFLSQLWFRGLRELVASVRACFCCTMSTPASIWVRVRFPSGVEREISAEATHVAGLRNAIKTEMSPDLNSYNPARINVYRNEAAHDDDLTLKGGNKLEDTVDETNCYIAVVPASSSVPEIVGVPAKEVDEGKQLQSK